MPMTVAVTGSTGFVGRHMVRALLERGHTVRALVRSRSKAEMVLPRGKGDKLVLVAGDIGEARAVTELLEGADACINLLGIIREVRGRGVSQTFKKIHVEAARHLVHGCERGGVKRYLQMSALGVSDTGRSEYQKTKFEAETIVRLSTLDWTIFRPSLVHGPESEFIQMAKGWVTGRDAPWVFIPYFQRWVEDKRVPLGPMNKHDPVVAPVHVDDVAAAFCDALEKPESIGEIYNLVGSEELSFPEMLRWIRDHVPYGNASLEPFGIPGPFAAGVAKAAGFIGMGDTLPFDEGMALMGSENSRASLDKAVAHLGFTPRAFRGSFQKYAAEV